MLNVLVVAREEHQAGADDHGAQREEGRVALAEGQVFPHGVSMVLIVYMG